ncbi:MAG TPA: hypothetical protein VFG20_15445 [Planctomycetaceae bacterium]|nr:hypothetical protein [Planctomycetaceae bacterium]
MLHPRVILLLALGFGVTPSFADPPPGFNPAGDRGELVRWSRGEGGIRIFVNLPSTWDQQPRRELIVFATPNGNTIEQTLGCVTKPPLDWRHDIQHVLAQVRRLREIDASREFALAVVQAPQLSWPAYRSSAPRARTIIRELVEALQKELETQDLTLTAHSGGGSFITGYINAHEQLPSALQRIVYLDANYSYSDEEKHGDKFLTWLNAEKSHRLVVIAYDDREITLNGKKVVGPEGGTFRATERMQKRFASSVSLTESTDGSFRKVTNDDGRLLLLVHPNPDNKILHTALVGEMNGVIHGRLSGTEHAEKWGTFGGPRAYQGVIPAQPFVEPVIPRAVIPSDVPQRQLKLPSRAADAPTGSQFLQQILPLSRQNREAAILQQITRGNVPDFLRTLKPIRVEQPIDGKPSTAAYFVTSDYLAVGTNDDFLRLPITPQTAIAIGRVAQAQLITRKISDDIFSAAERKLTPQPMTKDRDAVATFGEHHRLIEEQRGRQPLEHLIVGIKKDVVISNRLREKPHKVAIYGWHYPHGQPIQSLYVGHVDWYVDYSHGVRLIADEMLIEGEARRVADVLKHPQQHVFLSDEGPLDVDDIIRAAQWFP